MRLTVFSPVGGIEFSAPNSMISSPFSGKVGIFIKTFDVGLRLPLTDFQDEILQKHGCNI